MPRRRFVPILLPLLLVALGGRESARADDLLGEAWEPGITEGVTRQEQDREHRGPEVILRQAELLASRPSDPATRVVRLYLLARAYALAGDAASARSVYREVLQLAPRCYFAHHDLAMLALNATPPDRAGAERELRQALTIHPRYLTALRKLSRLQMEAERVTEAADSLRRIIQLDPRDLQARYLLAQAYLGLDRLDEAEREVAILLRQDRKNPSFRELMGDIYLARGRLDDALRVFREIAVEYPASARPLQKVLDVLNRQRKQGAKPDVDAWIWALEGLLRLEQDEQARAKMLQALNEFRTQNAAEPPTPTDGPPTDAQIAAVLDRAPPDVRVQVLGYVFGRPTPPEPDLLKALMLHISWRSEPTPAVRQWSLRVLGRYGARKLVGLVRHALGDPDAEVRKTAVDALLELAQTEPAARGAAFLILGLYAEVQDAGLAAAARAAVLSLAKAHLDLPADDVYRRAESEAFQAWWAGPVAQETKIQALASYPEIGDEWPEDILLPYVAADDAYVAEAAWRALGLIAEQQLAGIARQRRELEQAAGPDRDANLRAFDARTGARAAWLRAAPPFEAGALRGDGAEQARGRLAAWADRKP